MTLPIHRLGPSDQPRLDRDAEAMSQRALGLGVVLMPLFLVALTCGGLVLVGDALWRMFR
jgi:hypothetical protein